MEAIEYASSVSGRFQFRGKNSESESLVMPRPDLLPIRYMDDLHTNLIGCSKQEQFMIVDYYGCGLPNLYVVKYVFNMSGEFKNAKYAKLAEDASGQEMQNEKNRFLSELEPYELCDIRVRLFEVTIDDLAFGLLYSEKIQSVNLEVAVQSKRMDDRRSRLICWTVAWTLARRLRLR